MVFSGCRIGSKDVVVTLDVGNKDVFNINGVRCTLPEAKVYLCNFQNIYGSAYGLNLWNHDFGDESLDKYVKDITVSELSRIVCMDELAAEKEIVLTETEQQKAADASAEYYNSLSDEEITYMGITETELTDMYADYALAQKLYDSLTGAVDEEVSDDEARVLDIMQIFVADAAKASEVAGKLAQGDDFTTVASDYNEKAAIEINVARGDLPEAVEEAAYNLDNDEISGQIQADDGYYFIKCVNKNVEDMTASNKLVIAQNREKAAFNDVYDEYVSGFSSSMNEKLWNTVEIDTSGAITTNTFFTVYDKYFSGN